MLMSRLTLPLTSLGIGTFIFTTCLDSIRVAKFFCLALASAHAEQGYMSP